MKSYDAKCPICGTINHNLYLPKKSFHLFGIGVSKRNLFQRNIFEKEPKNLPAGSGEQGILAFLLFEYQRKNF